MIATCPACGKRYRVPDEAVPAGGRNVRCAACGHAWTAHADFDRAIAAAAAAAPPPVMPIGAGGPPPVGPAPAAAAPPAPEAWPAAAGPAVAAPVPVTAAPAAPSPTAVPTAGPAATSLPPEPAVATLPPSGEAFRGGVPDESPPRRRRWVWVLVTIVLLALVAGLAIVEFAPSDTFDPPRLGLPAIRPADLPAIRLPDLPPLDVRRVPVAGEALDRLLHPPADPPSPLRIVAAGERRTLANGTRLLLVSGTVRNLTAAPVPLAGIDAALLDPAGHAAFRWRIAAPARVVAAHGAARFESVVANFPPGATILRLQPR